MDANTNWSTAEGSESHDAKMPTKKLVAVFLLWLAFVIWNGWGLVTAIQDHAALGARDPYSAAPTVSAMILNFWALASALFLALNAMNPFGAYNGKRLAFGCMAVAIMTGRLFISPLLTIGALTIPPFWLFLVAPFGLMVSGIVADILLLFVVGTVFVIFTIVPTLLLAQIGMFEKSFKVYRQESEGLGGYIGRGLRWLANEPEPDTPPDDTKGARFATDKEITALTASPADASFARSMAFGHRHGPLTLLNEKHVLIMASTRSGKGVTLIIPHLLRYQGSAFVLDPKGENAKATSRRRAQLNDQVHVLDPLPLGLRRGMTGVDVLDRLRRGGGASLLGCNPRRLNLLGSHALARRLLLPHFLGTPGGFTLSQFFLTPPLGRDPVALFFPQLLGALGGFAFPKLFLTSAFCSNLLGLHPLTGDTLSVSLSLLLFRHPALCRCLLSRLALLQSLLLLRCVPLAGFTRLRPLCGVSIVIIIYHLAFLLV